MTEVSNLTSLISNAVAAKMTPEFIEKEVDSRIGKLIVETIDSALRTYSDTGKMIKEAVQAALRVDSLDLPSYGSIVAGMLKTQIEAQVSELVAGKLADDMGELLSLAPKEIKLSKIAEDMLKNWRHDEAYGPCITVEVETNSYGSTYIYLDEERHIDHRAKYEAQVKLFMQKDGTIFSATVNNRSLSDSKHIGRSYGLEQKIRAFVACGTRIIIDEDAVVISKGDY